MFTGLIEEIGKIEIIKKNTNSLVLKIQCKKILEDLKTGDSVAVNGICLTVTKVLNNGFLCDVMHETLNRSSIKNTKCKLVNLERAMKINERFAGHIVSGHIDSIGKISSIKKDDNAYLIDINTKDTKYIIEKGSITIDGISLTVVKVYNDYFRVSIIPHTYENTILSFKKTGDIVNLENDIISKYIEKLLFSKSNTNHKTINSTINKEFLIENGF